MFTPIVAAIAAAAIPVHDSRSYCSKTFTVAMDHRAAGAIYAGTRDVSRHELGVLGYIEMCQRHPRNQARVRVFNRAAAAAWNTRRNPPLSTGLASWYDDAGQTASGSHSYYGVAVCGSAGPCYSFGTQITFYYNGRSVTATVDDHGPYAGGRNFDLNQNTAAALGFSGVDTVGYHVG